MRKSPRLLSTLLTLCILLMLSTIISAQTPQITRFDGDLESITPDAAESGTAIVRLRWHTNGMRSGHQLILQVFVADEWHNVTLPDNLTPLASAGELDWTVPHTLDFAPPMFRLLLIDSTHEVVSQAQYVIPYATGNAPQIITFVSRIAEITTAQVRAGQTIPIEWHATGRTPNANPVFEQVMPDGRMVNVELPRRNQWVRAQGGGAIKPVPTDNGIIWLRMRLIDVTTGETLVASNTLAVSLVEASAPLPPTDPPPSVLPPSPDDITNFEVSETAVNRGDVVTVSWGAINTDEIWLATADLNYSPISFGGPTRPLDIIDTYGPFSATGNFELPTPADYEGRGLQIHIGRSPDDLLNYRGTKRLRIEFADQLQALIVNQFATSVQAAQRGDTISLSWDVAKTRDEADTLFIRYFAVIEGAGTSPHVAQNGEFTGLSASGSLEFTIPSYDGRFTRLIFNLGRDLEPNITYDITSIAITE